MNLNYSKQVTKFINSADPVLKKRLKKSFEDLAKEPPKGDIKNMSGRDGYRLRIGKYRILFSISNNEIIVHEIGLRGQIYKKRG